MHNVYREEALRFARICFANWNRDPASPSCGCFDRQYWGWKKKDMPDATFQAAIVLVLRASDREGRTEALGGLLPHYVAFLEKIQHGNGSFDQIYPNERAPGVIHDMLSSLVWLSRWPHLPADLRDRLERIMERGVSYALSSDEKHGEIANHFAQYAWELINYGIAFGRADALAYGRRYLERTLALFRPEEGWFLEYDGADAGYQTRCVSFLARIAELTNDDALWDQLERAVTFLSEISMPDGSLHPMLGVRSTALAYVSGIERVAQRFPHLRPFADRMHESWRTGKTPTPTLLDFENGLRIADDGWEAAELRERRLAEAPKDKLPARDPAEPEHLVDFDLPQAGLLRRVTITPETKLVTYVGSRLGGTVVIYDCTTGSEPRLAFEDSGYLLKLSDGTRWVMRHAGSGEDPSSDDGSISLVASFAKALHEDLSPSQMLLLRTLNLTVLRSQFIGDIFKKLVVRRLISGRELFPLKCRRSISWSGNAIVIADRFEAGAGFAQRLKGARLFRCRRTIANHMASSRYFQPQELTLSQPWIEELSIDALDGRIVEQVVPPRSISRA